MITILDYLLLGWLFWPVAIVPLLIAYALVNADDSDCAVGALILSAVALGACLYRYPEFRAFAFTWSGAAWLVGGYVVAGGILSLWKWVNVLMDFKRKAPEALKKVKRPDAPSEIAENLGRSIFGYGKSHYVVSGDGLNGDSVYYPNYKVFPIATWWVYWPFFTLSVVFDPINRLIRRVYDLLKGVYERMARTVAVK